MHNLPRLWLYFIGYILLTFYWIQWIQEEEVPQVTILRQPAHDNENYSLKGFILAFYVMMWKNTMPLLWSVDISFLWYPEERNGQFLLNFKTDIELRRPIWYCCTGTTLLSVVSAEMRSLFVDTLIPFFEKLSHWTFDNSKTTNIYEYTKQPNQTWINSLLSSWPYQYHTRNPLLLIVGWAIMSMLHQLDYMKPHLIRTYMTLPRLQHLTPTIFLMLA